MNSDVTRFAKRKAVDGMKAPSDAQPRPAREIGCFMSQARSRILLVATRQPRQSFCTPLTNGKEVRDSDY